MNRRLVSIVVFGLALAAVGRGQNSTPADNQNTQSSLILYDNFNSSSINPAKWAGLQNYDPDLRETIRELTPAPGVSGDYRLHLMHRAYSTVTDDTGSSGGLWGLAFPNPSAVTAIGFTLSVNQIAVASCTGNPGIGVGAAEFRGSFFNTQSSPTSSIGDVLADISVSRTVTDTGSTLTAVAFVNECADTSCATQTNLAYHVLGQVKPGSTNFLYLQWDQPNHQFVFGLNNESLI